MMLGVCLVWLTIFQHYLLLTAAAAASNPCITYSGTVVYFLYPNAITRFDTASNGTSTQDLSAGPSLDNLCAQQPNTDLVLFGDITHLTNLQAQSYITGTTPSSPSGAGLTLAVFSLTSLAVSYISYTQTGDAPLLSSIPATPSAIFLNSTCLFAITPYNSTFGAFIYTFNSPTLTQSASITSFIVNTNGIDMTSLTHAGIVVINGNLYVAGGYASNGIYTLNGTTLQRVNTSGTLPTGAITATTVVDSTTNKQLVAMISASDPSIWMFDPSSNILQNSATGPQNASELVLGSTGQQLLAFDPNWGRMQQFFPASGTWTVLNATTSIVPLPSSLPTHSCTPAAPMTQSPEVIGDSNVAAKIGGGIAGGIAALALLSAMAWFCHRRRRRVIQPSQSHPSQLDVRNGSDNAETGMTDAKPKVKRYNFNAKIPSFRMLNTSAIAALYPAIAKTADNNIYANPTAPEGTMLFKRYELIQSVRLTSLADGTAFRVGRDIKRSGDLVILKFMLDHNEFHKDLSTTRFLRSSYVTIAIDSFELPCSITQHQYISVWDYRPTLATVMNDGRLERSDHVMLRKSARSICEAVQWIHSKGIVHLQLQPTSIVHERTDPTRWLITDFQHACALSKKGGDVIEPIDWTFSLNAYSAPEMFTNEGKLETPATADLDVWSLWCILVEIATGVAPFHNVMAARKQQLAVRPNDPAARRLVKTVLDLIPTLASVHRRHNNVL